LIVLAGRFEMSRAIELLVNLAILCLCVVLSAVLVKKYFIGPPPEPQGLSVGTRLSVPDVDWQRQPQTVVLALQQNCRFCTESAPFYKTLIAEASRRGVRVVAVFPNDEASARAYLAGLGVEVPDLKIADFRALEIRGTPTVLLANRQGVATHVWRGKLPGSREQDVLDALVGR
jgi:hypothetical protein